jgi:hypothetical protein
MRAKVGDVIECLSCRKPVGIVFKDIPDGSKVLGDHLKLSGATFGPDGYLCGSCNRLAVLNDVENERWTIQISGECLR